MLVLSHVQEIVDSFMKMKHATLEADVYFAKYSARRFLFNPRPFSRSMASSHSQYPENSELC